jgi:DNA-binding CsgD family transcriptional regulator/tetratricopeptide (TPR) repeat protein
VAADAVEAGRQSIDKRAWADAYELLTEAAGSVSLDVADLERLATAAYLSGHDVESSEAWARAHQARLDAGEFVDAVRSAFWLGYGLIVRGETARGGGWMARARTLVDEHELDCAEAGYLLVPEALMALGRGDATQAQALFEEVISTARRFDDTDLDALGMLGCGQAQVELGRIAAGVSLFDQAMVSVMADDVSPVVAGIVYCAVIDQCQGAFDVRRAREWTTALSRWCEAQPGLVPYRGQCLVHRSQILQLQGAWSEAFEEAMRARDRLAEPPHPAIGMAHYQLGEMYRLQGQFDQAEQSYERANEHGRSPQPGLSLLRLAQRRVDGAAASIERSMAEASDHAVRMRLLPAYIEIMLAANLVEKARGASDELFEVAAEARFAYLDAAAAHCGGAVLLAEGQPRAALKSLREAWQTWQELEAPYEAAKTRVLLAIACQEIDDRDGAELEYHAACRVFDKLGADPDLKRAADVVAWDRTGPATEVTPREHEVLRLLAAGKTNREIAATLIISEKTVERHVSNIFTKVGVSNRAAATAYAYDHGLV